jgi:hypothetical protein
MLTKTALALICATGLAVASVGAALAAPPVIQDLTNNFPNVKKVPQFPGMTARIHVTSGTAKVIVLDASTVTADGQQHTIKDDQKIFVDVEHDALVTTGTAIWVEFDGASGTYTDYRGGKTVEFSGQGTIDQTQYDEVQLFGEGHFTVSNWTSAGAHRKTVVHMVDVRDVLAFEDADVTVTNCWVAGAYSTVPMKTSGCRFPHGNLAPNPSK